MVNISFQVKRKNEEAEINDPASFLFCSPNKAKRFISEEKMIGDWIGTIICWIISLIAIAYGFYLTKEVHKKKSVVDYAVMPSFFNISSDTFIGWVFGAIAGIIFGLFVGLFFKILPCMAGCSPHFRGHSRQSLRSSRGNSVNLRLLQLP